MAAINETTTSIMENQAHTIEPQQTANLSEPALSQLLSRPTSCEPRPTYATDEEATRAWELHKAHRELATRLTSAGYPERAVMSLGKMRGPGLEAAERLHAAKSTGIVFLIGDRGPGKTQIGTYLASRRVLEGGKAGLYRKALDLWGEIKATWRQGSSQSEDEVVRRFRKATFLVIDEAQERGDTEADRAWCDRMLTHLIDHRYDSMLPTVIIANLSLPDYEKTIPASIRSRAGECGGVKVCDWPSYRVKP